LKIRDHVEVASQPTVVRLEHLQARDAAWISESYYVTEETARHLETLRVLLSKDAGCGVFLIGHYGSGKSHFLAYVTQQLRLNAFAARNPVPLPISLLNYKAARSLESIVESEVGIPEGASDRRVVWEDAVGRHPSGLILILDELSEYLRSKPSPQNFNEDLRFLQFLGEWAQGRPLWILAAMQEQIEHTGEIEYDLFRKIKDRYPIRLLLTPSHIRDLIARRLLRKKASYAGAVERLARDLQQVYPNASFNHADLCEIYPLHPATLDLLEEVRDRFSQARGIVDFTLTQLTGNEARGVAPFLDEAWGRLLTPDRIVDHFSDLFEVQPEFLPIAQRILPYFRSQIPSLFRSKTQQDLAWRLVKLLILVYLSPRGEGLNAAQAAEWLAVNISSIDPEKNAGVIRKILETMARQGSYVAQQARGFALDLEDDSKERLEVLLAKTASEIAGRGDSIFEDIAPLVQKADFNPFSLPRDRWHARKTPWHFHDWDVYVYFGGGAPPEQKGLAIQVGLPWGPAPEGACYRVVPRPIERSADILELAALHYLKDRPAPARVLTRIHERIASREAWFASLIRSAYMEATVIDPEGARAAAPLHSLHGGVAEWLNALGEWMLRRTYPLFERFAPGFGPLPKEAYRQFMRFASERDLGAPDAPEFVKLIREAYLVPMGLMQRKGSEYAINPKLEANELVRLLSPILQHHPSPARVYEHLRAPVYGLTDDQIHLLLLVLLIQGEVDIVKGSRSYRETYETLANPLQYDRILPGHALNLNQLRNLEVLCEGFRIPVPKQWSVMAQKRAVEQLRKYGRSQRDLLSGLATKLKEYGDDGGALEQAEVLIAKWLALENGDHELQGFQHFERAIGPIRQFIAEANDMASLPQRIERLIRETQRLRHLLGDPALARSAPPDVTERIEKMQPPPPLSQPEAVEAWLAQAQAVYQAHQQHYRDRHEEWRRGAGRHAIWSYELPKVARSRHVMLADAARELEALMQQAKMQACSGLTPLEFQPICRCGFDGVASPLSETMQRFEAACQRLETELCMFFQQDKVKSKVREWAEQGLELNTSTLSYLEGKAKYPEVDNLQLFDQHLAGLELVKSVPADAFLDLVGGRVWDKAALMNALERFFQRTGARIVVSRQPRDDAQSKKELVAWCYEMALRSGRPLPSVFSRTEQSGAAGLIDPRWVSPASLSRLEEMRLGEEVLERVLDMILNGLIRIPEDSSLNGAVGAAAALLSPTRAQNAAELAAKIERLYEQHERMVKLRPEHWLALLDRMACAMPEAAPERLEAILENHLEAQWIVVDCLGLPLAGILPSILADAFPAWRRRSMDFACVSEQTSTEAFYLTLIEQEFKKPFEKINVVDHLIHERRLGLRELARVAKAELEIAFRKLAPRMDPNIPVLIFGDHGFRLAPNGRGFMHGGPSALERMTIVARLEPDAV